jgi:hypothetical protein
MAKTLQVKADIIADTASYVAGVKRATAATDKFGRATKKAGSSNAFRGIGRSAIAATAGVVSLYGAYSQGKKAIDATTKLAKGTLQLQRVTNLSTRDASRFAAVLQERGIEANKASVSFTALSKQIVAAQSGTAKAADAFKKLGVSQELIKKGDTQAVLLRAADGLSKMGAGAQRTALAAQLFGKGYKDLLPLLLLGSKGISEQTALAGKLGAEFSGSSLSSAKQYIAAQREMKTTTLGLQVALGTALMPALTTAMHAITGFVLGFRDGTGAGGLFRDNIKGIAIALAGLGAVLAAGKIAGSLTSIGSLLASVFSNPYTAAIAAVAIGIAAVGTALYLAYTRSKSLQKLVAQIGATVGPIFKSVGDAAKRELPGALAAAGRVARSITRLFVALKPVIVPIFKAIAAVASTNLRGIGPVLNFVSQRVNALTQTVRALLNTSRSVFKGVASAAGKMRDIVVSAFSAAKSGVDALVNAIARVGNAVNNLPGASALKKLAQAVGARSREKLDQGAQNVLLNQGAGSMAGALRDQQALLAAQAKVAAAKTKKAREKAAAELAALERRQAAKQARASAGETLKGFIEGIRDTIRTAELDRIMAPVNLARAARAARETGVARGGLGSAISRAQAEAIDPRVQARYARDAARLDARMVQARKQGNLEAIDALQSEKDALDARYGPAYLAELQDQLAQLNENEIEASSEAAATAFANTFSAGMQNALDAFMKGGTVTAFFASLTAAMQGSGVSVPGLPASVTAGVGEAAAIIGGTTQAGTPVAGGGGPTLAEKIRAQLLSRPERKSNNPHLASDYAKMFGVTQAQAFAARPKPDLKGHPFANKVSGGMLTPGMLTLVGETGPELIMGGKVSSATRTNRMGGGAGMNITVNAVGAAADDPMLLARQLGWQLATR